jgi:RNA 3'-terminal phosphate cyclase (GTP)
MIELDGSYLEGGGQIVRTALALSTIAQKAFEVKDIRKGRSKAGLKNQHLFCIKALEELCNSKTEGVELGSEHLKYWPGKIKGRTLSVDIGTAGSITLLLQSLLIPSIFAKVRLKIIGGTDVSWSPSFDYFNNVFLPQIRRYADIEASLLKRGYYPKGGGKVDIKIKPKFSLENLKEAPKVELMEQHSLVHVKGVSHASLDLQKANVAERQAKAAKLIVNKLNCPVQIRTEYCDTLSTGSGITLWVIFSKDPEEIDIMNPIRLGADSLGERGKRAEEVGREAADKLLKEIESKAAVDRHLGDNLIPFIGLIGGKIKVSEITNHTLTNIYVCEQFLGKVFKVDRENRVIEAKIYK